MHRQSRCRRNHGCDDCSTLWPQTQRLRGHEMIFARCVAGSGISSQTHWGAFTAPSLNRTKLCPKTFTFYFLITLSKINRFYMYFSEEKKLIDLPSLPTTLVNCKTFYLTEGLWCSFKRWRLWGEPVVACHTVALKRTGCDVWQLECQASNVTASVQSDHLLH